MNFQKLKNNSASVMAVIIISKLVGMLRDVVLADKFGTSNVSDAYLIAISIPTLLFHFIGHALSTSYQPMYNKIKQEKGEEAALAYSNNLTNIALLICTVIVAVLLLFPSTVVRLFAAGFDDATVSLTAGYIRVGAASLYLMTLISIFGGYLNAHRQFIIPAAISLPRNAVLISSIFVCAVIGPEYLGYGILLAYVSELLLLVPFVFKNGYRIRPVLAWRDPEIKQTLYIVLPILLGVGVSQINKIVDRSLASLVVEGGVSALSYACIINNAVQEVLVTGIITILFARCAEYVSKGEHEKLKKRLFGALDTMVALLLPASVGVVLLAEPIVRCFLCRGNFDENSLAMTVGALRCYTVGLVFLAVRDTLVKVFYAYKETKTTTTTSILAIIINIVLNFVLSYFMGLDGLALATSISAVANAVLLFILLRKKIGPFGGRALAVTAIKATLACAVMTAVIVVAGEFWLLGVSELPALLISVILGMIAYFAAAVLLRMGFIKTFFKKKKTN